MVIANYRLNLDALLARVIYRWHWKVALVLLGLLALAAVGTGLVPPLWSGVATLTIQAPPGAVVTVDGRAWPRQLYAGEHRIVAAQGDGRAAWADVTIDAGEALTLTLPAGLPEPTERMLPPAAPGQQIDHVWWADGAWRVRSQPIPEPAALSGAGADPSPTPGPGQTVAIGAQGAMRLSTIDAYAGLADQVHVAGSLIEAVAIPGGGYVDRAAGRIEVRGWSRQTTAITVTAPLTLVSLSPGGDTLLFAEATAAGGEQVSIASRDGARASVVAVPGHITRLRWRADGSAVVLHSLQGDRLALTLVRLQPSIAAAALADLSAASHAGDIVPVTWDAAGLVWVAPDEDGTDTLWRAPLTSLIPERVMACDARAVAGLAGGDLRALRAIGGELVIGRYQGEQFIGEARVQHIAPESDLMGIWQGDELLLQGGARAWLLTLDGAADAPEEPRSPHT